jgi:hypothetical protein
LNPLELTTSYLHTASYIQPCKKIHPTQLKVVTRKKKKFGVQTLKKIGHKANWKRMQMTFEKRKSLCLTIWTSCVLAELMPPVQLHKSVH